jgi:hypothetical protein
VADPYKHGNETSGSMKVREFLDQLCDYLLLKNDAVLWN